MSDNKTTYADCTDAEIEDLLKTALATVTELSTERHQKPIKNCVRRRSSTKLLWVTRR